MSLPMRTKRTCSVCGGVSDQTILASTNTLGAPDLDLRPAEMKRSTMRWWVQECPHCGLVNFDLGDHVSVDRDWLKGEEYQTCGGIAFASPLARRFYKLHLILAGAGNHKGAYLAALYAAWACDDVHDEENSVLCRTRCLEHLDEHAMTGKAGESILVQRADLMRRAGMFRELIREYETVKLSDGFLNRLIAFELEKAKASDTRCYRVSDVIA